MPLREQISLEQEVKNYFRDRGTDFEDNTRSFNKLDFTTLQNSEPIFHFEVKEKCQHYTMANWPNFAPEEHLFIFDELTIRKCLAHSPNSGVIVRVQYTGDYYFFSVVDLALMPRMRVQRHIHRKVHDVKGKWLVDLRNGKRARSLDDCLEQARKYYQSLDHILFEEKGLYGNYVGEQTEEGGIVRRPEHWDEDVKKTR
jgi:hypothetical protein